MTIFTLGDHHSYVQALAEGLAGLPMKRGPYDDIDDPNLPDGHYRGGIAFETPIDATSWIVGHDKPDWSIFELDGEWPADVWFDGESSHLRIVRDLRILRLVLDRPALAIDLSKALRWDPFAGDFGEPGDRPLRDKIVTFRKGHPCHECGSDIIPGMQDRSLTMLWMDEGPQSYRICTACARAMAISDEDDGKAWETRVGFRLRSRP